MIYKNISEETLLFFSENSYLVRTFFVEQILRKKNHGVFCGFSLMFFLVLEKIRAPFFWDSYKPQKSDLTLGWLGT